MSAVRLLPIRSADGPTNMAADEVLLEGAARGRAALRFYTWTEPTLSLGYFQPAAERLAGLPWVRRASGGAALVHDVELTYALALPAGPPWQRRGESWICRMHAVIGASLADLGVRTDRCAGEARRLGPVLCFLHHTPGDLLLAGHKIGGSAQRRQRGAMMQHGGILLGQSSHTPNLPGLRELAGLEQSAGDLAAAIGRAFTRETGWAVEPDDWTADEAARIRELIDSKYAAAEWNNKR